jgi:hypothetical protein
MSLEIELDRELDILHASFFRAGEKTPLLVASSPTTAEGAHALAELISKMDCVERKKAPPAPVERLHLRVFYGEGEPGRRRRRPKLRLIAGARG